MVFCLFITVFHNSVSHITEAKTTNKVNFWVGLLNEKNVGKDGLETVQ